MSHIHRDANLLLGSKAEFQNVFFVSRTHSNSNGHVAGNDFSGNSNATLPVTTRGILDTASTHIHNSSTVNGKYIIQITHCRVRSFDINLRTSATFITTRDFPLKSKINF